LDSLEQALKVKARTTIQYQAFCMAQIYFTISPTATLANFVTIPGRRA
jgi:hypothetical protein